MSNPVGMPGARTKNRLITLFASASIFALSVGAARAQVIVDGSLVARQTLQGPDYEIVAGVHGQVRGGDATGANATAFFSFEAFSLGTGESATFRTNPQIPGQTILHWISRVTGPGASVIQGRMNSPGSGVFWFINPNGVVFGPGASIEGIQGPAYFSTSDRLVLLQDSGGFGFFSATDLQSSLTTGSPWAFGFLGGARNGAITVNGAQLSTDGALTFVANTIEIGPAQPPTQNQPATSLSITGQSFNLFTVGAGQDAQIPFNGFTLIGPNAPNLTGGTILVRNATIDVVTQALSSLRMVGADIDVLDSTIGLTGVAELEIEADTIRIGNSAIRSQASGLSTSMG
ncbi:MAG: filamentous hemagglutinin N-terminal domain-containing protein, partial [Alphaproteobacteria bacterium]|nr:filamentous hemagglutinin N-terminal domain-containing protein [Alphaproteobacteria bacterium]